MWPYDLMSNISQKQNESIASLAARIKTGIRKSSKAAFGYSTQFYV